MTALDDETFSEKKENKKTSDQKKKKLPSNLLATETNKERERYARERERSEICEKTGDVCFTDLLFFVFFVFFFEFFVAFIATKRTKT